MLLDLWASPRVCLGRGGYRFIYARGEEGKKWHVRRSKLKEKKKRLEGLEVGEKATKGNSVCPSWHQSTWICISKGAYLHHSSFVKLIFQMLSCCVNGRFELPTSSWIVPSLQAKSVMVQNVIKKITICFTFVFACNSDGWLPCPGASQISLRY